MYPLDRRLALAAMMTVSVLAIPGPAPASDLGIAHPAWPFQLDPATLEPGCASTRWVHTDVDVTQRTSELFVQVSSGSHVSIDQVLVPDALVGYAVHNVFDTGTTATDADIDPGQTAVRLTGLSPAVRLHDVIVCVSDPRDATSNEPYVVDGFPGEVAAINRPILQPVLSALGVDRHGAYQAGFGYEIERGYDPTWRIAFAGTVFAGGDPMASPGHDAVTIGAQVDEAGVRGHNDVDDAADGSKDLVADHGQPTELDLAGDAFAYLPPPFSRADAPIAWSLKASLAPESSARSVALTEDMIREWEAEWYAYHVGAGPKPALRLAPGTRPPSRWKGWPWSWLRG